jgi:hypothetical protein
MAKWKAPMRAKRDANEAEIVAAFRKLGCTVFHTDHPLDLAVGKHGLTHLVEVKAEGGKLTPAQEQFLATWKGDWAICRSVDDVVEYVAEWDDWAEDEARRKDAQ